MDYQPVHQSRLRGPAVLVFAIFWLLVSTPAGAQSDWTPEPEAPLPSFQAASIHENTSGSANRVFRDSDPRHFVAANVPMRMIIDYAYDAKSGGQISGGPAWIDSERYDIDATVDSATAERIMRMPREEQNEVLRLMLRSLLAERLKLQITHQIEIAPIYALTVANDGPRLIPTGGQVNTRLTTINRPGEISAVDTSVGTLAQDLGARPELGGRAVVDLTGIKGYYDFTLRYRPSTETLNVPAADSGSPPSLFSALQAQLGLTLEPTQGPVVRYTIAGIQRLEQN